MSGESNPTYIDPIEPTTGAADVLLVRLAMNSQCGIVPLDPAISTLLTQRMIVTRVDRIAPTGVGKRNE
jgi:hypothetical protein